MIKKIIIILQYNNNTKHYKIVNNNFNNENQKFNESDIDLKLDADLFEAKPDSPKYFKKKTQKNKEKNKNINNNHLSLIIDKEDTNNIDLILESDNKSANNNETKLNKFKEKILKIIKN